MFLWVVVLGDCFGGLFCLNNDINCLKNAIDLDKTNCIILTKIETVFVDGISKQREIGYALCLRADDVRG